MVKHQPIETLEPLYATAPQDNGVPVRAVSTVVGFVFLVLGLAGIVSPGFLGTHLSTTHNLIYLLSGCASLYFGMFGTLSGSTLLAILFAVVYGGLALAGFALGASGEHSMAGMQHQAADSMLLRVIPGKLELALRDHLLHALVAGLYAAGAMMSRSRRRN